MKFGTVSSVISLIVVLIYLPSSFQDCARPTDLQDNVVISPDQTSYGTYYSYTASCDAGYELAGPTTFYCSSDFDGTPDYWDPDPSLTVCNAAAQCSKPNITDTNVVITPDQPLYDTYDLITFTCSIEGYTIVGSEDALCGEGGEFMIATQPTCAAGCSAPSNSNGTGSYGNTDEATFSCAEGYSLITTDDSLTVTSICEDGDWNPDVVCQEPTGCYPPANRVNVNYTIDVDIDSDGTYPTYTKLDMACAGQRSPWGPEYSYCNTSRQWEPDPELLICYEKCAKPSFADPDLILTSKLQDSSDEQTYYDHTDTVIFSCPGEVFVDGPWRASCNDGTWSTPIGGYQPVCRANCTAPDNTLNAGELFQHGQAHIFQCDPTVPGLVRLGGPSAFCNDGTWKPNLKCRLKTEL